MSEEIQLSVASCVREINTNKTKKVEEIVISHYVKIKNIRGFFYCDFRKEVFRHIVFDIT